MTRFARAKGSKASNERVAEEATDWSVMKKQLLEKQNEKEEFKKRKEFEQKRQENFKNFLTELKTNKFSKQSVEWATFSDEEEAGKKLKKKVKRLGDGNLNGKLKKAKKIVSNGEELKLKGKKLKNVCKINGEDKKVKKKEAKIGDLVKEINEFCKEVPEGVQEQYKELKSKLEQKLAQPIVSSKKKRKLAVEVNEYDDIPEETSISHSEPKNLLVKKSKIKKLKIVIPSVEQPTEKPKPKKKKKKQTNFTENNDWGVEGQSQEPEVKAEPKKPKKKKLKTKNTDKIDKINVEPPSKTQKEKKQKKPKIDPKNQKVRRKPEQTNKMFITINGVQEEVVMYSGFPVKKSDADRLQKLRQDLIKKGIPFNEVCHTMKLERRKAEKALVRAKKQVCFQCRKSGHLLSDCPEISGSNKLIETSASSGICFKCGSTEHTSFACKVVKDSNFKFAKCFICSETGHISNQCPDNPRGLYPKGGACRVCGDVTHLKKDCPRFQQKQEESAVTLNSLENVEGIEDDEEVVQVKAKVKKSKTVKF